MKHDQAIQILSKNIQVFSERKTGAQRQRRVCVQQLLEQVYNQAKPQTADVFLKQFRHAFPQSDFHDRALACLYLSQKLHPTFTFPVGLPSTATEHPAPGAHGKICLVRNRLNESAYEIFSASVVAAKSCYLSSFSEACEDVFDNRCEFGILPIENTSDGKLFGFYSMLDRYELKICAVCHLEPANSEGTVRYALIGKHLPDRIPKQAEWNFEGMIVTRIGKFPKEILDVASEFQADLIQIDSIPILYDDGLQKIYFTFQISPENAAAFHLYMSQEYARYALIGCYPILNDSTL